MAIENPSVFGKAAEGTYFTDRAEDAKRLHANLTHGINTIIISPQLNFLRALADGVTTGFSRKDVIKKYRLESSANVQSVKKALLKKDLIDVDGQETSFNDSLFKQWLKRQTFYD